MNANDVMCKYSLSIDDVLNVRAIFGGTVSIVPDELLDKFTEEMYRQPLDSAQSTGRCKVRFNSVDDSDYNRAMALFLMLPAEELRAIL